MAHFKKNWTGEAASWISIMKQTCWDVWKAEYLTGLQAAQALPTKKKVFDFRAWVHAQIEDEDTKDADEFQKYTNKSPTALEEQEKEDFNPISWWNERRGKFPSLYLYAFDTLSCPAMSTECERVFSGAKRTISSDRNRLSSGVIEACECLKTWWRVGVVTGSIPKKRKASELEEDDIERIA
jgi:hypothetical protein